MTLTSRLHRWLLDACVPAIRIPRAGGPAYFAYASYKSVVIDGQAVCAVLDPHLRARDADSFTHVVIGHVARPEAVPGVQLPHRLNFLQFFLSLLFLKPGYVRNYRFINRLFTSHMCKPHRVRSLHVLRNFLIAHYFSLKFRALAEACNSVHVICYYDATMLGVLWAFRRLGKPAVDIQHGHLGATHGAYSNTNAFQLESDLKPTRFLVWAPKFGRFLEQTLGVQWESTDYLHIRALTPASSEARTRFTILYTLQYATVFPDTVETAARRWPDVQWVFRLHPYQTGLPLELEWLRSLPNATIVGPEEALPIALSRCDLHITYNSSVVHEAAAVGKPSLHLDPDLADRFQNEAEHGLAKFVPMANLVAVLEELIDSGAASSTPLLPPTSAHKTLCQP